MMSSTLPIRFAAFAAAALLLVLLGSCLSPPDRQAYDLRSGPDMSASEVSVVLLADATVARIDGMTATRSDWTEVRLRPGSHRIEWTERTTDEGPPRFDLPGLAGVHQFLVVLEPGHTYSLRARSNRRVRARSAFPAPTIRVASSRSRVSTPASLSGSSRVISRKIRSSADRRISSAVGIGSER